MVRERIADFLSNLSDGRTSLRRQLESVYARRVVGAAAVTSAMMKMVEKVLNAEPLLFVGWAGVFFAANWLFVKWKHVADEVDDALDTAADVAEDLDGDDE